MGWGWGSGWGWGEGEGSGSGGTISRASRAASMAATPSGRTARNTSEAEEALKPLAHATCAFSSSNKASGVGPARGPGGGAPSAWSGLGLGC